MHLHVRDYGIYLAAAVGQGTSFRILTEVSATTYAGKTTEHRFGSLGEVKVRSACMVIITYPSSRLGECIVDDWGYTMWLQSS